MVTFLRKRVTVSHEREEGVPVDDLVRHDALDEADGGEGGGVGPDGAPRRGHRQRRPAEARQTTTSCIKKEGLRGDGLMIGAVCGG